ncbi:hypothetical protein TEA_026744 [Camellia sinensis var. sinensis]|uniref:AMP-activated protein kinase glycogen-binding domain-containing protein n=1 Tax=Camellia sinensis var. sinensis TaxID=542762 RepID=A0A4S4DMK4_CAMSN|nr:hypothetical protein TEA_026744 [Camellia sinensis var. sinensis]
MVSLITSPNHFLLPSRLLRVLNFPAISPPPAAVVVNPRRRLRRRHQPPRTAGCGVDLEEYCSFGFVDLKRRHYEGSSWCCSCKGWDSEGDLGLEAEILEFMNKSEKPEVFPTKKELVDAGRMDLVEAIVKKGGWLSLGWDLGNDNDDDEEEEVEEIDMAVRDCDDDEQVKVHENGTMVVDCDEDVLVGVVLGDHQQRIEGNEESNSIGGEIESYGVSSSGRSLEMGDEQETGIEGILNRLEKQRNLSFGINMEKNGYSAGASSNYGGDDSHDADSADLGRSSKLTPGSPKRGKINNSGGMFSHGRSVSDFDGSTSSLKPEMWRTWSIQRAGFSDAEFEAAEISFNDNQIHEEKDATEYEVLATMEGSTEALDKQEAINHKEIRTRLQQMELELASALHLLRSKSEELVFKEGHETSNDLWKLSDAWEFQENEIMSAQDRLRSIRAKLAVLEGKMALAIIDAQKTVEEKQKRIHGARSALQLLHTTCIVWPNAASEVLLSGSFDGWTTQCCLAEEDGEIKDGYFFCVPEVIKFIVDGIWRTDPLRPTVCNNGHENNLLIIA